MKKQIITLLNIFMMLVIWPAFAADDTQQGARSYGAEVEHEQISEGELAQMLAPIALYPDSLLTHILMASTYPIEVVQADRWAKEHPDLEASAAVDAVKDEAWDPSVKALVAFPRVLERMSSNLEWTQKIGDAFLQDETNVLKSIQQLRYQADAAGNLDKMEHLQVERDNDNIVIEPAEPEVVYVPYYDTRIVYGHWHWPRYRPVFWDWHWRHNNRHYSHHYHVHHGLFSWHPRIRLRSFFFFTAFNWHRHHVVILDRRYLHRSHYRYHPRRLVIAHDRARRWEHNPVHRRGVAYRTERARIRFNSTRPSLIQTREVSRQERQLRHNDQRNRVRVTNHRHNSVPNVQTREQRLRNRLEQNRAQTRSKPARVNSRVETREDRNRAQRNTKTPARSRLNKPNRTANTVSQEVKASNRNQVRSSASRESMRAKPAIRQQRSSTRSQRADSTKQRRSEASRNSSRSEKKRSSNTRQSNRRAH